MFTSTYTVMAADVFIGPAVEGPPLTIRSYAVAAISGVHARAIVRGGGYVPMHTEPGATLGAMVWGSGIYVPGFGTHVELSGTSGRWVFRGNAAPVPVCDHCHAAPAGLTDLCGPCLAEATGFAVDCDGDRPMRLGSRGLDCGCNAGVDCFWR